MQESKEPLNNTNEENDTEGLSEGNPDDVNRLNGILMDIANLKRAKGGGGDGPLQTDEEESPLEAGINKTLAIGRASSTTSVFEMKRLE